MSRAERPSGAFSVHKEPTALVADSVFLDLAGVMGHVVHERQIGLRKHFRKCLPHQMRHDLAIRQGTVDGRSHGSQIFLS